MVAAMTPDEIIDRFNPAKRAMPLEGMEALELYMAQIGRNLGALKDAMESLNTAIAERNALLARENSEQASTEKSLSQDD
jgi:hypothetical protein